MIGKPKSFADTPAMDAAAATQYKLLTGNQLRLSQRDFWCDVSWRTTL